MLLLDEHLDHRLPHREIKSFPSNPIPNVQGRQYAFNLGRQIPKETYNRSFKTKFYVPGKSVGDIFSKVKDGDQPPRFRAGDYVSKVSRDAVEALYAVEREKSKNYYFDELDKDNLFPRGGRKISVPRSIATETLDDDTINLYHQPNYIRTQQNQSVGDTTREIETQTDVFPNIANPPPATTVLGTNTVLDKHDYGDTISSEIGRIGARTGSLIHQEMQTDAPAPDRVRDLRSREVQTNIPDLDSKTIDLIFSNAGKFQVFIDRLRFGNETLQQQLQGQENQLGRMTETTFQVFRNVLISLGFEESTIPAHPSPNYMMAMLRRVNTINPVAIREISAMRNFIEQMKADSMKEIREISIQTSPIEPLYPSPSSIHVPMNIPTSSYSPIRPKYPSPTPTTHSPFLHPTYPSPTPVRLQSPTPAPAPSTTYNVNPLPHVRRTRAKPPPIITKLEKTTSPQATINENSIFGDNAATDEVSVPTPRPPTPPPPSRKSTRKKRAPERLSYDEKFRQTSKRSRKE